MNPTCQRCKKPCRDTFLCATCESELRDTLVSLAFGPKVNGHRTTGLLDACEDVVLKRTRLSTGGGHRKRGDEQPAPFLPDETRGFNEAGDAIPALNKDGRAIPSRQGQAAQLLASARNTLSTQIRDLCETRGVECPEIGDTGDMALWLAARTHSVACSESAGQLCDEVEVIVRRITRVIDRPVSTQRLGYCPTELEAGKPCRQLLQAREDAIEVHCPKCHTTRTCDRMRAIMQHEARRTYITWEQILDANKLQPDGWRVADRTLREWRSTGALRVRGWLRPSGDRRITQRDGEDKPLYSWSDVETLRSEKPQKLPTGAAARRR